MANIDDSENNTESDTNNSDSTGKDTQTEDNTTSQKKAVPSTGTAGSSESGSSEVKRTSDAESTLTYNIRTEDQNDSVSSDDGSQTLVISKYQLLYLEKGSSNAGSAYDGIQKALDVINSDTKANAGTFAASQKESAQQLLDDEPEWFQTYSDEDTLTVKRADMHCLPVLRNNYKFTEGAVHGVYGSEGYSFDAATGQRFTLSDVVQDSDKGALADAIAQELLKAYGSLPDPLNDNASDISQTVEGYLEDGARFC